MKILKAAALALPLMGAAGVGTAQTAAAATAQGPVQSVGYYVPTCGTIFVGYDWYGYPIYQRVCG